MSLVLYHDNCPDGFTAAWAAWKKLGNNAEYRGVNYSDPLPNDVDGRSVYLVDFSFSRQQMEELARRALKLTVFDHHKTAKEALHNFPWGHIVFDMERSGAGITWDELHPGSTSWLGIRPKLISYVEDRDLWRWALPSSREVSEYIFATPRTFPDWDRLAEKIEHEFDRVVEGGIILLEAKRIRVATVCRNVRWFDFNGASIPIVNCAWDMSEIGEYLCKQFPKAPCGGYYFDRKDKRQWGFRSRSGFDVSALCKQYGGGGHQTAAGFESEIGWLPNSSEEKGGGG